MKNSKKGFTLTEILIVTAIIVILSGAAIAGVAVTIANANERGQHIQQQQGVNWESEAVLKVKNTKIELGNEQIYEESADTPTPTAGATSDSETLDEGTPTPTAGSGSAGTGTDSGSTDTGTDTGSTGTNTGSTGTNTGSSGSDTNTNTGSSGSSVSAGITLPDSMSTKKVNDYGWGGDTTVKINSDISSCSSVTVTVSTTDGGTFSEAWGINDKTISSDGSTITYTLKNNSNPWWTDPTFTGGDNSQFTFNYKFSDQQSHPVSVNVVVND
ncbi:MAG: prepilin-type N-terminal cleavage/methylation domain-containing protein [Clostridiales bacterium]|nr:prepilin-type N-terminal cleavage/methylation domain-containing protein [Clostridiales bacterium]